MQLLSLTCPIFFQSVFVPKAPMNVKMYEQRLRYLKNDLPDHVAGQAVVIPVENIQNQIFKYVADIKTNLEPIGHNGKDGLYLGSAGISYMFYHLSKVPQLQEFKNEFLADAVRYLQPALKICANEVNVMDVPAFMLGNCGVYAVAAAVFKAIGKEEESHKYTELYQEASKICRDMFFLQAGSDELFVGRAGYLCGALWMAKETGEPLIQDKLNEICSVMMASGRYYSSNMNSPTPLMYSYYDVEYIGAGHGISSILQMIMSVPGYLDANPSDLRDVKVTADYIMSLQDKDGNFPAATDEVKNSNHDLVHWCHGAGGVVYFLAKAYLLWHNKEYLDACKRLSNLVWEKGLLKKGPGLCHGVAGNGYVFLLMYRLTGEDIYLHRAIQFAQFLETPRFRHNARIPDNPFSLFEGIAGTVCFLGDMLHPKEATFPFCDVFH